MKPRKTKYVKKDYVHSNRKWVGLLTAVLCLSIFVFVASYLLNFRQFNKYYLAYNSIASVLILNIIIFLYFNYIAASEKIQENEKKYALLFDNVNDIMLLRSISTEGSPERYLEANAGAVAVLGYSKEELSRMLPDEIVAPSKREEIRGVIEEILHAGKKTFDTEFMAKDGRVFPVEISSHVFNLKGERVMMSIARDLTERFRTREFIKETEKRYRNIFENLPDGVVIQHFYEEKSIIGFANQAAARIFGCDAPEELIGKDFYEFVTESDIEDIKRRAKILFGGEKIPLVERSIRTARGMERTVEIKTILYSSEGEKSIISIIRDITQKRANEKILQENDRQLRRLLDISPDAVFVYDWEKYLYTNESGARILGEESSMDVKDKSIYTYVHPEHFDEMRSRLMKLEEPDGLVPMIEQKLVRKDKTEVFVETKSIRFPFSGENVFVSIARDITERLMLEEERRKNEERYRQLIETFPDAIFVYDWETYHFANPAAAKLLGLDNPEELFEKPFMYFLDEFQRRNLQEQLRHLLKKKGSIPLFEEEIALETGKKITAEIQTIQFPYSQAPCFLSIIRDVTERKRSQELLRQMERHVEYERMRTEYFANISHEFRTPIHVISGTLQLMELKNGEILERIPDFAMKNQRHLQIMKQNKNRLLKLVNNLIDINKIDAGFQSIRKKNLVITEIIENIVFSVTDLAKSEQIEMIFEQKCGPVVTACDADKMERIMLNLLSNAIKFTPKGGRIQTTLWQQDGKFFVSVEDTGIGIEKENIHYIFDRFSQVEEVFTRKNEGSGIGLSLVKALVRMHGGAIEVSSEVGKGSRFTFSIPVELLKDEKGEPLAVETTDGFDLELKVEVEFSDVKKRYYEKS